jgi:hypothetical protein
VEQAQLQLKAADARLAQTRSDRDRAQRQLEVLDDTERQDREAAIVLIQNAQRFMDVLIEYTFLAIRSLEIYTLADLSNDLRFDFGYIHPDDEENKSPNDLAIAYKTSWLKFAGIVLLRKRFDDYFASGDFVHDIFRVTIKDEGTLADFRVAHSLVLVVDRGALPSGRLETKVESVHIAMVGAKGEGPTISCIMEHSGGYTERLRNGTQVDLLLGPRSAVIQAIVSSLEFRGGIAGGSPEKLGFGGRGVASTWHLFIEQEEMTSKHIDLSGLTEIEVAIGYAAFLN